MNFTRISWREIGVGILAVILTLIPFHTFLVTWIDALFFAEAQGIPFLLAAWKEALLLAFGILWATLLVLKKIPFPKLDALDICILLYIVWSLATGFWRWGLEDIGRIAWGAKYALEFPAFFFLVRHFPLEAKEKTLLFRCIFSSAALVIFFGIAQKVLPADFLTLFGYSAEFSSFDPQGVTAYCQKISFTDTCRLQSFLSGPNQFAAYLLFVIPLFFFLVFSPLLESTKPKKRVAERAFGATFFLLGLITLFFAYSRAGWGGFLVSFALGFTLLFYKRKWFLPLFWTGLISSIILLFGIFLNIPRPYDESCAPYDTFTQMEERGDDTVITRFFCEKIYRASSSQGHFERTRDGLAHVWKHPFGTGLGDSGPASARFYENKIGFIPESWYLQVGIDTGWPGIFLFLGMLFFLGKNLFKTKEGMGYALFCGLVGISIMSLKLHSWESASVALSFWGACGIALSQADVHKKWWKKIWQRLRKIILFDKK